MGNVKFWIFELNYVFLSEILFVVFGIFIRNRKLSFLYSNEVCDKEYLNICYLIRMLGLNNYFIFYR